MYCGFPRDPGPARPGLHDRHWRLLGLLLVRSLGLSSSTDAAAVYNALCSAVATSDNLAVAFLALIDHIQRITDNALVVRKYSLTVQL